MAADILDAAAAIQERCKKGEGRAADNLARRLGVSTATVYQARRVLRHGGEELLERVRRGEITIKKAYNSLLQKEAG
jgi:transposase